MTLIEIEYDIVLKNVGYLKLESRMEIEERRLGKTISSDEAGRKT